MPRPSIVVFDLDGTLIDSDEALVAPFLSLGVPPEEISFGHPIEVECARLGLRVEDYVAAAAAVDGPLVPEPAEASLQP